MYIFLLLFWNPNNVGAQNGYPATFNINGHSTNSGLNTWAWSFGEPLMILTPNKSTNIFINTGYLQNDFTTGIDLKQIEFVSPFKIGPCPVLQNLNIKSNQNGVVIARIEIRNEQGVLFKMIQGPFSAIHFEQYISFTSASTGIYFILIHYVVDNSFSKTNVFKIIKS